ncbi:hypothetical protein TRICI_005436 [Trichomonascus ciferrii]|uniref:Alpha/beta hydrolase fold-3 domain-containing protein n=1 Tax=Trichomonascus ciferrii TaxID=44093 RepID=A0A642USJ4_9ASCO|nr:hypothetical protein TRICI_005436 [Trichomonascus ciferrii]
MVCNHLSIKLARRYFMPSDPVEKVLKGLSRRAKGLNGYNKAYSPAFPHARWVVEAENRGPEDPVLVYFHGGGYVFGFLPSHGRMLIELSKQANNPRLSVIAFDYSLAPEHPFPKQLQEAADLYKELVDTDKCQKVILSGDSAGGNLASILSAHIQHHCPHAVLPQAPTKPYAVFLISPWLIMNPARQGSYVENYTADILGTKCEDWATAFCPDEKLRRSKWTSPLFAPPEFWSDVFPEQTAVSVGENEMMIDDVKKWVTKASINRFYLEKDGAHNSLFLDPLGVQSHPILKEMLEFLKEVL